MKWVKKANQQVAHQIKNHLNRREVHIALTVFISLMSVWLLNLDQPDYYATFQMHYLVDFIRSTYLFCLCFLVHVYTNSKRILGLMGFIICTILFDVSYLYNSANFHALDGFRAGYTINLTDLFTSYEILCLLFSFKYWIKNAITKSKGSINNRGNLCDSRVHKANTARNKKRNERIKQITREIMEKKVFIMKVDLNCDCEFVMQYDELAAKIYRDKKDYYLTLNEIAKYRKLPLNEVKQHYSTAKKLLKDKNNAWLHGLGNRAREALKASKYSDLETLCNDVRNDLVDLEDFNKIGHKVACEIRRWCAVKCQ